MIEKLDRVTSLLVRVSSADHAGYAECFTCGAFLPWQELQCGHFISRKEHAVRFDRDNMRPQCYTCNELHAGEADTFEERLRDEIGDERVDMVIEKSKEYHKLDDQEMQKLYTETRLQLRRFHVNV